MNQIIIVKVYKENYKKDLIEIYGCELKKNKNTTYINVLNTISMYNYNLISVYLDEDNKNTFVFQKNKVNEKK